MTIIRLTSFEQSLRNVEFQNELEKIASSYICINVTNALKNKSRLSKRNYCDKNKTLATPTNQHPCILVVWHIGSDVLQQNESVANEMQKM